jgi:hypothetical protein
VRPEAGVSVWKGGGVGAGHTGLDSALPDGIEPRMAPVSDACRVDYVRRSKGGLRSARAVHQTIIWCWKQANESNILAEPSI